MINNIIYNDKIHILAEKKLQELEETELSREELLFDSEDVKKGVPLHQDPFFQFIKNNRIVREMLVKPNEEFSVKRIIDIALRQVKLKGNI